MGAAVAGHRHPTDHAAGDQGPRLDAASLASDPLQIAIRGNHSPGIRSGRSLRPIAQSDSRGSEAVIPSRLRLLEGIVQPQGLTRVHPPVPARRVQ